MKVEKAEAKPLEHYLKLHYPVTFHEAPEGGYVAVIEDLSGCMTQGETLEETMSNILEAKSLWLEAAWESGMNIPLPSSEDRFSGKVLLRMSKSLHRQLATSARREGVSLNLYIVSLLSGNNAYRRIKNEIERLSVESDAAHASFDEFLRETLLSSPPPDLIWAKEAGGKPGGGYANIDTLDIYKTPKEDVA